MTAIYLLICTISMAAATLYADSMLPAASAFDKVVRFFLVFISIHSIHAFIVRVLLPGYMYIDTTAPFGLMYGPIIYFAFISASGIILKRKNVVIHSLPFITGLICYFIFLLVFRSEEARTAYLKTYHRCLYLLMLVSWITYSLWALLYKGTEKIAGFADAKRAISTAVIILLTLGTAMSFFFYYVLLPGVKSKSFLGPWFIYGSMLASVVIVFRYNIFRILKYKQAEKPDEAPLGEKETASYHKSAVAPDLLDNYLLKLEETMQQRRLYLNPELTADELASELRIPKHHLTQLFSRKAGMHFNQYINKLRIDYACSLLKNEGTELKVEELALECGFNSKTSFNRNFKNYTGHTPSEYRELYKNHVKSGQLLSQ